MKVFLVAFLTLLCAALSFGQSTSVSGQVTDTGGQSWNNGTISFSFVPAQNQNLNPSVWTGGAFNPAAIISTSLTSTGSYSISIPSNTAISPVGSSWTITVCPQSNPSNCFYLITQLITGPTQTINLTPPAISISAGPGVVAYSTAEITAASIGSQFYLLGTGMQVCQAVSGKSCTTWVSSGGASPNSPLPATSGPGPVFNVRNYGAHGDTQASSNCTISANTNLNCSDVTFSAANVGQHVSCSASNLTVFLHGDTDTFTAFVDSHDMTVSRSNGGSAVLCEWGTPDDTAVSAALTAALALGCVTPNGGNVCTITNAPTLYFPAGGYNLFGTSISITPVSGSKSGFAFRGDGLDQTKIYWHANATNASTGAAVACANFSNLLIQGLTLDGGAQGGQVYSNASVYPNCTSVVLRDVAIQRFSNTSPAMLAVQAFKANNMIIVGNNGNGLTTTGGGEVYESIISNNSGANGNILVQNTFGMPTGPGFRWMNSLMDECASPPCLKIQNSTDVWFIGSALFTGASVDGNSVLHMSGGSIGPFNTDNNLSGLTVSAGGMVTASDVRFIGSGTGKCINNSGVFRDNGGNSCENLFLIQSGTSTGTTAVLTVTGFTANANANCSAGDALEVQGASIVGYNGYFPAGATSGITAVGTNTIQYTTAGSNLGALGNSGYAMCRNLQSYTGNLPIALLNNPIPNTCYITGTFAATTTGAPMCNFRLQSATNITRILAASTTATACTVAPVVTLSDGTNSVTLTLSTAKSQWDSAVDTSTGVGTTIFKPNGTIQLTNTAGTCTTSPTNFSVSYNIAPILSN